MSTHSPTAPHVRTPAAGASPATDEVVATTQDELVAAVRDGDAAGRRVVVVGGDEPGAPDALTVRDATAGMRLNTDQCSVDEAFCGGVLATLASGESWADLVATAVAREWVGLECLAAVPGTVGEAVAANAGAYGGCVADTIAAVRTWDRQTATHRRFAMADAGFVDGGSTLSTTRMPDGTPRYVVLDAEFLLPQGDLSAPIRDQELAAALGVTVGQRALMTAVREAVLARA